MNHSLTWLHIVHQQTNKEVWKDGPRDTMRTCINNWHFATT